MFKALRPSSWGLKIIDILLILVVVSFVVAFAAPTSGLGVWLHQGWTLAGLVLKWFFVDGLGRLFTAL